MNTANPTRPCATLQFLSSSTLRVHEFLPMRTPMPSAVTYRPEDIAGLIPVNSPVYESRHTLGVSMI